MVVKEYVKLVIRRIAMGSKTGICEVRRTCDDSAGFVLIESLWSKNVELRVKAFRGVRAQFNFLARYIIDELEDTSLNFWRIGSGLNIVAEICLELLKRARWICKE